MTSWQSVLVMSAASSAPRRVGLMPTTTAPTRAAPASRKMYSAVFSRRTPTWNGPSRRRCLEQGAASSRFGHHLAPRPLVRFEQQAPVVVVGPEADQLGRRGDRRSGSSGSAP